MQYLSFIICYAPLSLRGQLYEVIVDGGVVYCRKICEDSFYLHDLFLNFFYDFCTVLL